MNKGSRQRPSTANSPSGRKSSAGLVKSAHRVFQVLEMFKRARRPLAAREIADAHGYPMSSTAALLKSISSLGYIEYDREIRAYYPTVQLIELGEWVYVALAQRQELIELLEQLSAETGKVAILGAGIDIFAQYVHVIAGRNKTRNPVLPGTRRLLCRSGVGWAMLSQMKDERIRAIVNQTNSQFGRMIEGVSYDWLMINLREARRQGYAVSRGMVVGDIVTVAAPLKIRLAGMPLAVGLNGTTRRMDKDMDLVISVLSKHVRS